MSDTIVKQEEETPTPTVSTPVTGTVEETTPAAVEPTPGNDQYAVAQTPEAQASAATTTPVVEDEKAVEEGTEDESNKRKLGDTNEGGPQKKLRTEETAKPEPIPPKVTLPNVEIEVGNVLRIRGIPWSAREPEIKAFFSDCRIVENGVLVATNAEGRQTGEAFLELASPADLDRAMKHDRESMGHRYIECYRSSNAEKAKNERTTNGPKHSGPINPNSIVYKLRGLPFTATSHDIKKFFHDIVLQGIHVIADQSGRATGECFIEVVSETQGTYTYIYIYIYDTHILICFSFFSCMNFFTFYSVLSSCLLSILGKQAMAHDKQTLGHRYVESFPSNSDDLSYALARSRGERGGRGHGRGGRDRYNDRGGRDYRRDGPRDHDRGGYGGDRGRGGYHGGGGYQHGGGRDDRNQGYSDPANDTCVKMLGLPFQSDENDITAFFTGF